MTDFFIEGAVDMDMVLASPGVERGAAMLAALATAGLPGPVALFSQDDDSFATFSAWPADSDTASIQDSFNRLVDAGILLDALATPA